MSSSWNERKRRETKSTGAQPSYENGQAKILSSTNRQKKKKKI